MLKKIIFAIAFMPLTVSAMDIGETSDFYIGVGHGLAVVEGPRTLGDYREHNRVVFVPYDRDQQLKGSVSVSEIHLGYNVNPFLSFELGYADYDKERMAYQHQVTPAGCGAVPPCWNSFRLDPDSVEIDTSVVSLGALLKYPVHNNFSVYGLLSYDRVNNSYRRKGNKDSEISRQVGYGAGIRWAFSEDFAAKLQWKKTKTIHTGFAYNKRLNLSDTRLIFEMSL